MLPDRRPYTPNNIETRRRRPSIKVRRNRLLLATGVTAAMFAAGIHALPKGSALSPRPSIDSTIPKSDPPQSEPKLKLEARETAIVSLADGSEIYDFITPDSQDPQSGRYLRLGSADMEDLKRKGYDPDHVEMVLGDVQDGPDPSNPDDTITYLTLRLVDGTEAVTPEGNVLI